MQKGHWFDESDEQSVVFCPDTVANPLAVMIEVLNAPLALHAVFG